ncbi:MAG: DUF1998 domain-containing protein [Thermoguttaceae bacterium]|nr:DUF1998 domain-containing protein [Thermoguttaceae bacterium]
MSRRFETSGDDRCCVGQIRPSQLLWNYGPGALIDLPNLSVITMGLDQWERQRKKMREIREPRLLRQVRKILPCVRLMLAPPYEDRTLEDLFRPPTVGAPVRPFPEWMRCTRCNRLAPLDSKHFKLEKHNNRPELTRYYHDGCSKGGKPTAVPARFLLACKKGHIDDFPWHDFVHIEKKECPGQLYFYEVRGSFDSKNLIVKCSLCQQKRSLIDVFGERGKKNLPKCRGRFPHLGYDRFEECDEPPRPVLLGASNCWFPATVSALSFPVKELKTLEELLEEYDDFDQCEADSDVEYELRKMRKDATFDPDVEKELDEFERFSAKEIADAVIKRAQMGEEPKTEEKIDELDIKRPEWDALVDPNPPNDDNFHVVPVAPPREYSVEIASVGLVDRLRKVNALVGFTRIETMEERTDPKDRAVLAPLANDKPEWTLACEVRGEGVFIRFNENSVKEWEKRPKVKERAEKLKRAHAGFNRKRGISSKVEPPPIRYVMLHTFAHLLIREAALECGYNAASVQERIYASDDKAAPMAGLLFYTAASDSDGTLGGLVELGKPESLGRIIALALKRACFCSSDPLCAERDPEKDSSLSAAACHNCAFLSETSCECGNKFLDRALVVPTFDCKDAAFFKVDRY